MTGFGQNQDRERSFSEGFDAHLVKPVDMALLDDLLISAKHRRIAGDGKRSPS
jgi:CheY-like chemotaxis protein